MIIIIQDDNLCKKKFYYKSNIVQGGEGGINTRLYNQSSCVSK